MTTAEAKIYVDLANARVQLEKAKGEFDATSTLDQEQTWFVKYSSDLSNRNFVFGRGSMEKLRDLGPKKWVSWLKEKDDAAQREVGELLKKGPAAKEAAKIKWEFKIRLLSDSHTINKSRLRWWNDNVTTMKILPVQNVKNELDVKITLFDTIPLQGVYFTGLAASHRILVAMNIGSQGFFWWKGPRQLDSFFEGNVVDLESRSAIKIGRSPVLKVDWQKETLNEQELKNIALCASMLPLHGDPRQSIFDHYLTGLGFLGKTDIHIQLHLNAFHEFYKSVKKGLLGYRGVVNDSLLQELGSLFKQSFTDDDSAKRYIEWGENLENNILPKEITLSETAVMKVIADVFFLRIFREQIHLRRNSSPAES